MKRLLRNLAVSLMAFLIYLSVLHVQVKAASPTDGEAYGVLLDTGELLYIRSFEHHEDTEVMTIEDIYGKSYTGTVFCYIENGYFAWTNSDEYHVKSFRVAEDFIINSKALDDMFYGKTELETVDLTGIDSSMATELDMMFYNCNNLKSVVFPDSFNTTKVITFERMFQECHSLKEIDISLFDFGKAENLSYMFEGCWVLENIKFPAAIDVSNVKDFTGMFYDCFGFKELDLSSFNTASGESFSYMFGYCENLKKLDISNFDTRNTKDKEFSVSFMLENLNKLEELKIGKYFVNWEDLYLPQGKWKNGSLLKTTEELASEYPANAESWAGAWIREFDKIEKFALSGYEPLMPGSASVIHYWTEPYENVREEFIWSSSDESVLTVDQNGTVYAQKVGKAVITAKTTDGSNLESSITVVVNDSIAYAILSDDGEMVLIRCKERYGESTSEKVTVTDIHGNEYTGYLYSNVESAESPGWYRWDSDNGDHIDKIKKFRIAKDTVIIPLDIMWWLSGADNLEEVDLTGINTTGLTNFNGLFYGDKSLKKVNFGTMDTSSATDMWGMFEDCAVLEEITFGDKFTKLNSGIELPVGRWAKDSESYSAKEFVEKFSKDVTGLAGTWKRTIKKADTFNIIPEVIEVQVGQWGEIPYEYKPDDATIDIEWSSSDEDGLYVWSSGYYEAKKVGEYTVTAHTTEGSDKTDTVKFIVKEKSVVTYFNIIEDEITVEVGNEGFIEIEYTPEDAMVDIEWISSDPSKLELDMNYFIAHEVGEYTVTAHTLDGSELTDTVKIKVVERGTLSFDPWMFRIFGSNRFKTGFAIAREVCSFWPDNKCDYFIVACGNNFADALAGSYLAAVKMAPILLINDDKAQEVADFIKERISSKGTIYILGGPVAVSAKAESILKKVGTVKRLQGDNRYATNLEIIKEAGMAADSILVATGLNYADSLSASATGLPILLVKDGLNDKQKEFLNKNKGKKIYVIGGENAVAASIEKDLKKYGDVKRIAGTNRVDTSVKIAETFFKEPYYGVVAYSHDFADGLCGGPFAYLLGSPLLLTREENKDITQKYIDKQYHINGVCLGGTARITDKTFKKLFGAKSSIEINRLEWK